MSNSYEKSECPLRTVVGARLNEPELPPIPAPEATDLPPDYFASYDQSRNVGALSTGLTDADPIRRSRVSISSAASAEQQRFPPEKSQLFASRHGNLNSILPPLSIPARPLPPPPLVLPSQAKPSYRQDATRSGTRSPNLSSPTFASSTYVPSRRTSFNRFETVPEDMDYPPPIRVHAQSRVSGKHVPNAVARFASPSSPWPW